MLLAVRYYEFISAKLKRHLNQPSSWARLTKHYSTDSQKNIDHRQCSFVKRQTLAIDISRWGSPVVPLGSCCRASCGSISLLKPPRFTKFRCDTLQGQVTGKCRANLASYGRCTWCNKLLWVKTVCKSCIIVHQFKIITFLINNLWVSLHQLLLKGAQSAWNGTSGYGYHFKGFSTVEYKSIHLFPKETQVNPYISTSNIAARAHNPTLPLPFSDHISTSIAIFGLWTGFVSTSRPKVEAWF